MQKVRVGFALFIERAQQCQLACNYKAAIDWWQKAATVCSSQTKRNEFYRHIDYCETQVRRLEHR